MWSLSTSTVGTEDLIIRYLSCKVSQWVWEGEEWIKEAGLRGSGRNTVKMPFISSQSIIHVSGKKRND